MDITNYEAAALYAYSSGRAYRRFLVLDLDDCSYGLCSIGDGERTELVSSSSLKRGSLWDMSLDCLRTLSGTNDPKTIASEMKTGTQNLMRDYLKWERVRDSELDFGSGLLLTCSQIEGCLEPVKAVLTELLKSIETVFEDGVPEDCGIVVLGEAQSLTPIDYYISEWLSISPALPDERFSNHYITADSTTITEQGRALNRQKRQLAHTYSVIFFNLSGQTLERESIVIGKAGQDRSELTGTDYIGPIFVSGSSMLTIGIDGSEKQVSLSGMKGSELAEVALGVTDEREMLFIRPFGAPEQVTQIKLAEL